MLDDLSPVQFLLAVEVLAEANEPDILNAFDAYRKTEDAAAFFERVSKTGLVSLID